MFSTNIECEYFDLYRIKTTNLFQKFYFTVAILVLFISFDYGCIADDTSLISGGKAKSLNEHVNVTEVTNENKTTSNNRCSIDSSKLTDVDDNVLIKLLLGKERFELIKQTFRNELKLYNNLNTFPKRIDKFDSYIQLYTICSYLSSILLCDIFQDPKVKTLSLFHKKDPVSNNTYSEVDFQVNSFPWVNQKDGFIWSVQSGAYGNVICGELIGGNKQLFPRFNGNMNSFLLSTYKLSSSDLEFSAFVPSFGSNIEYKKLNTNKKYGVCVKVFRSSFNKEYFEIWEREIFNLKWLEKETWIYGNYNNGNDVHLNFTPKQVYISSLKKSNKKLKRFKSDTISNRKVYNEYNNQSSHFSQSYSENQMFYPNVFEANYPWNINGKYWSSFLLMERFLGPSVTDISNYLLRKDVIDWTKSSILNEYIWSVSIIKLIYLFFQTMVLFTFSGKFIYQHCDLHSNNVIFLSENWKSKNSENNFSVPSNDQVPIDVFDASDDAKTKILNQNSIIKEKIIKEIINSDVGRMKIIDLTFVTSYNLKSRREGNFCYTYNDVSIPDLDNWTIFTYELSFRIDKIFNKHSISSSRVNPLSILIKRIESDESFDNFRPKFKGESGFWWENWELNNQVNFDEKYKSTINFGSYFLETLDYIRSDFSQRSSEHSINKSFSSIETHFENPISLFVYMRNIFYIPYEISSFSNCLIKLYRQVNKENKTYFQLTTESLVNYFASELVSFDGLPPNWIISESKGMRSHFKKCKNNKKNLYGSSLHFQEPCFDKYSMVSKSFPKYIQDWTIHSENDDKYFIKISKELINRTTSGIHFSFSILLIYQYEKEVAIYNKKNSKSNDRTGIDTINSKLFYSLIDEFPSLSDTEFGGYSESSKEFLRGVVSVSGILENLYLNQKLLLSGCTSAIGKYNIMGYKNNVSLELENKICSNILKFVYLRL
ncbi:hypothetical protein RS030_192916 [Cryptosporidium xiaoi]|uniref:Protein kinase domain-containing protein n=1 Tax=Cryptosporidium xiaoi TaxID=659607 RepID=A0AAV9XYR1_9CRYT